MITRAYSVYELFGEDLRVGILGFGDPGIWDL